MINSASATIDRLSRARRMNISITIHLVFPVVLLTLGALLPIVGTRSMLNRWTHEVGLLILVRFC